jgi:CubicO group peptidase (beta-lactamase class C family)
LVELGKLELEDPVVKHLPYFHLVGGPSDSITILQMLNHISGMPDVQDYQWDTPIYNENALEQYVRSITDQQMIASPGERFAYSNMAFECLGDVVGKVSGMTFADYVKKNILNPSGMSESTFLKPVHLPESWAAPHIRVMESRVWDGYPYNRMHGPSSTLHSNVLEMCNWAMVNLNGGNLNNTTILRSSSYDLLWKPWFRTGEETHVGLSWFIGKHRDVKTIGHSGGDKGFNTDFVMLPEKSMAVVVVCNLNPAPVGEITKMALDILLGFETEPLKLPAGMLALKELKKNGMDAAQTLWNTLRNEDAELYEFSPQHFESLFYAIDMDLVEESTSIIQLCLRLFPSEIIDDIRQQADRVKDDNPDNKAATSVLRLISDHQEEAK